MTQLSFSGLDELMLSMKEIEEIPPDVQNKMLKAGADVVVQAQKKAAQSMGVRDPGEGGGVLIESIQKSRVSVGKGGRRSITIYPRGERVRGKVKKQTVRNAEIAFINEYGKRGQPARPFIALANETSAQETTEAMAAVYDQWLKSKGL